jgi:hypothetical protein
LSEWQKNWLERIEQGTFDLQIALKSNNHTTEAVVALSHDNAKDAILAFSPSIGVVKAYHGAEAIKIAVCALIADKSCRLIPSRQMNPQAYPLVATKIVKDYWYLKLSEIKYAFDCGFKQKEGYGGMFHGFDESVMMLWIESYLKERETTVENIDKDKVAQSESVQTKILTDTERVEVSAQTKRILEIIEQFNSPVKKSLKVPSEFVSISQICKIYKFDESKVVAEIKQMIEAKFNDAIREVLPEVEQADSLKQFTMWQRARILRGCSFAFGGREGIAEEMLFDFIKGMVEKV